MKPELPSRPRASVNPGLNGFSILACLFLVLAATPSAARAGLPVGESPGLAGERLGKVSFAVSCKPSVHAPFDRGVALLHDFWYEEAPETQAMTYWARTVAAGHLREAQKAQADLVKYDSLMDEVRRGSHGYLADSTSARIRRGEMLAWVAFAEAKPGDASDRMRESADLQDKVGQGRGRHSGARDARRYAARIGQAAGGADRVQTGASIESEPLQRTL
jgi:hypothetical protein